MAEPRKLRIHCEACNEPCRLKTLKCPACGSDNIRMSVTTSAGTLQSHALIRALAVLASYRIRPLTGASLTHNSAAVGENRSQMRQLLDGMGERFIASNAHD